VDLQDLNIDRVVLHEVHRRTGEPPARTNPTYGTDLEQLSGRALDTFRDRIVQAMAKTDRCVQMDILEACPMLPIIDAVLSADTDAAFVTETRDVADALTDAQLRRDLPGGVVVVTTGTVGAHASRFFGVIKAETHNGFMREQDLNGRLGLKFLESLLLTPQTKLYKIGMFIEAAPDAEGDQRWRAFLYDDGMTAKDRYGAAQYFYEGFLGLGYMKSSARETKVFHDLTKSFIQAMDEPEEHKVTLHNALVTYLKGAVSPTVNVRTFADAYFGADAVHDAYTRYMYGQGFPNTAVHKDLSDIQTSLRTRRLTFRSKVQVTGPAEAFDELVEITAIEGARQADGSHARWTRITIKDHITKQE
jgi:hypothetical protein